MNTDSGFFFPGLMSIYNLFDYNRLNIFYQYILAWLTFSTFMHCLGAYKLNCNFWAFSSWVYPSRSLSAWSFFLFHSNSLAFTSITFKNIINNIMAFLFVSRLDIHLFSAWLWVFYLTPLFPSFQMSFWRSPFQLQYLVYKCSTDCIGSLQYHH